MTSLVDRARSACVPASSPPVGVSVVLKVELNALDNYCCWTGLNGSGLQTMHFASVASALGRRALRLTSLRRDPARHDVPRLERFQPWATLEKLLRCAHSAYPARANLFRSVA